MKSIITLLIILSIVNAQGQVQTNFHNSILLNSKGFFQKNHKNIYHQIASPDTSKIASREAAEANANGPRPFRFAEKVSVDIDVVKEADWITEGGFDYGKLTLVASKAKSISVSFNSFQLPVNTEMYVYNSNGVMIAGPITDAENNTNHTWGSAPFQGDSFNIEIKIPSDLKNNLNLNIGTIGYGYKNIFAGGFGTSAACEINVLCPLGNNWGNERPAVAKVIGDQGTVYFSGALIMNTCGTNIP